MQIKKPLKAILFAISGLSLAVCLRYTVLLNGWLGLLPQDMRVLFPSFCVADLWRGRGAFYSGARMQFWRSA